MNIEQTVSAAVAALQLGHTFTLDDLTHAIQARRQRTLRVQELEDLDTSDGLCAIWLIGETEDVSCSTHPATPPCTASSSCCTSSRT